MIAYIVLLLHRREGEFLMGWWDGSVGLVGGIGWWYRLVELVGGIGWWDGLVGLVGGMVFGVKLNLCQPVL